jgi:hypothetical protein
MSGKPAKSIRINTTALESDVIDLLLRTPEIRLNEIRGQLLALPDYKHIVNFAEIPKDVLGRRLDIYIFRILKKFQKNGDIKKRYDEATDTKRFYVTEQGKKRLPAQRIYNRITDSTKILPHKSLEVRLSKLLDLSKVTATQRGKAKSIEDMKTVKTLREVTPEGEAPVQVGLWLDPKNSNKVEAVAKNLKENMFLEHTAYTFVENCKNAILDASKDAYRWNGWKDGPPQIQMMIENLRTSLDFDATLFFQFSGKEFVEKFEWKKEFDKARELDNLERERYKKFKEDIDEPGQKRDSWIRNELIERVQEIESKGVEGDPRLHTAGGFSFFLYNQFQGQGEQIIKEPWAILDDPVKAKEVFLDNLAHHLVHTIAFNPDIIYGGKAKKEYMDKLFSKDLNEDVKAKVKQTLESMLRDDLIEIVPVYLLKLKNKQKAIKELWQAREGYAYF